MNAARGRTGALLLMALLAACSETRRSLGEDCLKDGDCVSGTCSQLRCSAPPRLLDGAISPLPGDASAPPADAGDAAVDAGDAAPDDARSEPKYPPSPDYVFVTLGLSLLLFLALQYLRGPLARVLLDFGRTPLFTYVAHLYIAHGLMLLVAIAINMPGAAINLLAREFSGDPPSGFGYSLSVVYLVWALVIALLIPLARWMAALKRRRRDWWLGYI